MHPPADAAIENNNARNSRVRHNTVYYNPTIRHAVSWSIEYRFPPTTASIQNNLTNLPIIKRHPFPSKAAIMAGNLTGARAAWFRDLAAGDVHLIERSTAIDQGVTLPETSEDIDGNRRPSGQAPDAGADEFNVSR